MRGFENLMIGDFYIKSVIFESNIEEIFFGLFRNKNLKIKL